ncbi:MAG: hypothetical protein GX787_08245 [Tissierellia bacterium]|nr:hypothetical protein [Tissierellia bacterium]
MLKLIELIENSKKELEVLEELKELKTFFRGHDGKMFSKRISDQLPQGVYVDLQWKYGGYNKADRPELRVMFVKAIPFRFEYFISYTGYGKDLEVDPLVDNKRINADNIDKIINHIVGHRQNYLREILGTNLSELLATFKEVEKLEEKLKGYNFTLIDTLQMYPYHSKTWKAINTLSQYLAREEE